jgi:hypothetical protein
MGETDRPSAGRRFVQPFAASLDEKDPAPRAQLLDN